MRPTVTRGATHNFIAPENWDPANGPVGDLQVRMDVFTGSANGLIECFSTWKPSEAELAALNAGGVIEVGLCVLNQPVMSVNVVEPVEPALVKYVSQEGVAPDAAPDRTALTINEEAHGDGA